MEGNIPVLLQQIDMESLALLFGSTIDDQSLAGSNTFTGDTGFIWDWVITTTPMNVGDEDIPIDGEVRDGGEGNSMFVFLDFLLISKDLEFAVMGADSEVDVISAFPWVAKK